jgi:3-hydroxyacyl-[acyl-carrier-protein] dehydratase
MGLKDHIIDMEHLDLKRVLAGVEEIRRYNPQRHEMEQLTAILYDDPERGVCAGYKDVTADEFWCRGHMPGMPLMPGVVMCEAAAQLCSYFVQKNDLMGVEMMGFGGLDDVRFRGVVRPGDRLVIVAERLNLRRGALVRCRFQAFVAGALVCEGKIQGIPLPVEMLRAQ